MNQIQQTPGTSDFGHSFNYAVWTPGTRITMANVPWNSDYRDIVYFPDGHDGLDKYLFQQSTSNVDFKGSTYAKYGVPVRVDIPFNVACQFNYLRVDNPSQPVSLHRDGTHRYYYFITECRYLAPNTTELVVQLDVWQTFGYNLRFGNCYIERGHIGIANEKAFEEYGRNYLAIPEGLDIGGEYRIVKRWSREFAQAKTSRYRVLVMSTVSLDADPGTVDNPSLNSATGSTFYNLPQGCEFYVFNSPQDFQQYMAAMADKPWITQGIISITAIPWSNSDFPISTVLIKDNGGLSKSGVAAFKIVGGQVHQKVMVPASDGDSLDWRSKIDLGRYRNLKKFLTSPYCVVELTSYNATPLVMKPEHWQDKNAGVVEVGYMSPPNPRIVMYPWRYNADDAVSPEIVTNDSGVQEVVNDGGEFLDMSTGIYNFPTFSIVNNAYISFMASNAHGIAFQHQSADWSQQKALAGNQLGYDQASMGISASNQQAMLAQQTATRNNNNANQAALGHTLVNVGTSAVGGIAGGAGGGAAGAGVSAATSMLGTAVNAMIDAGQRNTALAIANANTAQANAISTGLAGYNRDTNKDLADWAAKGDYQNAIAGINARVQDAHLTQPTTSGQVGGDPFNLAAHRMGYDVKVKMLGKNAMRAIGEYWLRYGYAVQQFGSIPDDFMVCEKFTYWKLRETYIAQAIMPEAFKQTIRGIFEKGVTVWKNPSDIGTIDIADNAPLPGVTL